MSVSIVGSFNTFNVYAGHSKAKVGQCRHFGSEWGRSFGPSAPPSICIKNMDWKLSATAKIEGMCDHFAVLRREDRILLINGQENSE